MTYYKNKNSCKYHKSKDCADKGKAGEVIKVNTNVKPRCKVCNKI